MRVIVTNCFSRIGLAAVNALGDRHEVIGTAVDRQALRWTGYERGLRSRHLRAVAHHPLPGRDPEGFAEAIFDACRRYDADAVLPTSTALAIALSKAKARKPEDVRAAFCIEDWDTLSWFADKWRTYEALTELGIPTPRTVLPVGDRRAELDELPLPLVAKPRLAEGARGIEFFHDRGALSAFLDDPPLVGVGAGEGYPYIVQEVVPGAIHDAGCCSVAGRPVTLYSQCRLVTKFEFGGPSFSVQLTDEPELRDHAARLHAHLGWNGFVVSEFLRTPEGRYYYLEGNPRFGAALQLIVEAGMNICQQSLDIFTGAAPAETLDYPVGMAVKWYSAEALAICLRKPRTTSAIAARTKSVFFPYRPGPTISNLRWGDLRHLAGIAVAGAASKREERGAAQRTRVAAAATPESSAR